MSFLLDTCAVSELVKLRPNPGLLRWLGEADETALYLSVITLGEIHQGVAALADSKRKRELEHWLQVDMTARFAERLLPFGAAEANEWGRLRGEARRRGALPPVIDAMLAATARVHGLTIVTRNTNDFSRLSVKLETPWTD